MPTRTKSTVSRSKAKQSSPDRRESGISSPKNAPLLRYLAGCQPQVIDTIKKLVEVESPSGNREAVNKLGEWLGAAFSKLGGKTKLHTAKGFGNHLQVDLGPKKSTQSRVLLLGHFDTVWDLGTIVRMPFRASKGRLWGPGVLDMKTGIAQMLFAIEALSASGGLSRPVTVLLVTDEEVGSESSRPITERIAKECGTVLVAEPSFGLHGALKTSRKGVGDYELKIHGIAAHSGLDFEKGASAILEMSHQLLKIADFTDLQRGLTVNPGVIQGGTRSNVTAAEATAEIDVRITTMRDAPGLDKKFKSLKPVDNRCRLEISGGINRPPLERSQSVVKLFQQAHSIAEEIGFHLDEAAVGGGSDGNFTAGLGIPTLDGLGAVGEGAHADNESVLISEIVPRTALLARLIQEV